ncbi:MAG: GNAT family N-acetyltransferase [Acidimicrobiales bacterium]
MSAHADAIARASARAWERMVGAVPGAWTSHRGGAVGVVTGIALQGMNGVWGVDSAPDTGTIATLLDSVAAHRLPFCMQLRPGWHPDVADVARAHRMQRVAGEPVMVLDDGRSLAAAQAAQAAPTLDLRQLGLEEGGTHAALVAAAFGDCDDAPYGQLVTKDVLTTEGIRCYVGETAGRAVTTCCGVTVGECVAIFSVATHPDARRRGYGAAVTARAVADGLAAGAQWAWLSSSEAGFGVYRALGFRVVERWDFWESTAQATVSGAPHGPGPPTSPPDGA